MADHKISSFDTNTFFKAAIPAYFFPFLSSGIPGYILDKPDLVQASYGSIALPSLLATVLCFGLLWQFQKRQLFLINRFAMTLILGLTMVAIAICIVIFFQLQKDFWYIVPSAFIGTAIVALTKPLKKTINHG